MLSAGVGEAAREEHVGIGEGLEDGEGSEDVTVLVGETPLIGVCEEGVDDVM